MTLCKYCGKKTGGKMYCNQNCRHAYYRKVAREKYQAAPRFCANCGRTLQRERVRYCENTDCIRERKAASERRRYYERRGEGALAEYAMMRVQR